MAAQMMQAFADAKPLVKPPKLTYVSFYGRVLRLKFENSNLRGRAFRVKIESADKRITRILLNEVPTPKGQYARGVSRVDSTDRLSFTDESPTLIESFGITPFTSQHLTESSGKVFYEAELDLNAPLARPIQRQKQPKAAQAGPPADPFVQTWNQMVSVEDAMNAFLAEHPELTIEVQSPTKSGAPTTVRFIKLGLPRREW